MPRKIYYNRTNTCDCYCGCENNLIPHYANRQFNKEGNWTGKWLCKHCYNNKNCYDNKNIKYKEESVNNSNNVFKIEKINEKGSLGWLRARQNIKAKKDGFDDVYEWLKWRSDPFNILEKRYGKEFTEWAKNNINKVPRCWINSGCKTRQEYDDKIAQRLGFKSEAERYREHNREYGWKKRGHEPSEANEDCTINFGEYKGEELFKRFLEEIAFEYVRKNEKIGSDRGIDFVCKNPKTEFIDKYPFLGLIIEGEYSIQLRMRSLYGIKWIFHIGYDISDYFILCAWDSRESQNILHVWIFKQNEIVRGRKFRMRESFTITNKPYNLQHLQRYELDDLQILERIWIDLKNIL